MLGGLTLGQKLPFKASGDFTIFRQISRMDRATLESKVGYEAGRLKRGAIIAVMAQVDVDQLQPADFSLGASSRWSRSKAAAPWAPEFCTKSDGTMDHDAIEQALAQGSRKRPPQDVDALKAKVIKFFQTKRDNAPAKVFPLWQHESWMDYPSATGPGVPQFKLNDKKSWIVARIIA